MISEKEFVHLIAKEVGIDHAIELDEVLRGKTEGTAELMSKIYTDAQSTIIKEWIKQLVQDSFDKKRSLQFYKKCLEKELTPENREELNRLNEKSEIHEFEKLYHSLESLKLKEQLHPIGRLIFDEEKWGKFENIQLYIQELKGKKVNIPLSEMMEKDLDEIKNLRIMNGLRSIDSRLEDVTIIQKLKFDEVEGAIFKLKAHYPYWDEDLQKQATKQVSVHLEESEQSQLNQTFEQSEMMTNIFAVSPKLGQKFQQTVKEAQEKMLVNRIDEVKKELEKQHVDYLLPEIMQTIEQHLVNEKTNCETMDDKQKILQELENTPESSKLLAGIKKELAHKKIKHTGGEVLLWVKKFLTTNEKDQEKDYQFIVNKIEKILEEQIKRTAGKNDKEISQFFVELNWALDKIADEMKETVIQVRKI
ncbi:MAG: hypothetical protein IC227_03205 [Enterococcus lacertideformus]|uniref:Uncharacterized protein n=1 Tax=Enterococcus lacertideformus TaxID=2771493 RepID=A0A931ATH7_9ENTE|nr:hypothetical protein [Enterococcus lacertideformus]